MSSFQFCNRCGQPASSHGKPCRQATYLSDHELFSGPLCRCPVEGCQFVLDQTGRSMENARTTFFSHLEWHERQGLRPGESGPEEEPKPPSNGASIAPDIASALTGAKVPPLEVDEEAWTQEVDRILSKTPPAVRRLIVRGIVASIRSLDAVNW